MKAATFARTAQKKAMDGARTAEIADTALRIMVGVNTAAYAEIANLFAMTAETPAHAVLEYVQPAAETVLSATAMNIATIAVLVMNVH